MTSRRIVKLPIKLIKSDSLHYITTSLDNRYLYLAYSLKHRKAPAFTGGIDGPIPVLMAVVTDDTYGMTTVYTIHGSSTVPCSRVFYCEQPRRHG